MHFYLLFIEKFSSDKKIDIKKINKMHEILLDSVCGNNKEPGKIKTIQNWIGPNWCTI